jgi:serine/threonine protein kinase/type II secretory pathway pseudopilin PulG
MNVETWQQLKTLFHGALDLGPAERTAFLAAACHGDDEIRNQVEKLLASHDEPGDFLVSPALMNAEKSSSDGQVRRAETEERTGQRIGPYEVIREIGHGGMGTVFLAVRADDQYRKQVAIKLVKRGMDSDAILRRFMMERQILANLEHPNIARLLEGGSTADGLPYFVMEYIEGQPITEYCDAHRLTTAQSLELFREVCAALHYAHQNLVVHRDIKPGNILVTAEGVPKLLDFGIAKLLSPGWANETGEATASMVRLMTPDYASPEQFRGLTITTASDVYSLGLVLYQLLSGHHPYRLRKRHPEEVAQAILQEEPEKPSTAAGRQRVEEGSRATDIEECATENAPLAGKTIQQSPMRNPKSLRGDLDNIVLKALRKEPERRYASVQEFSEDIRRHLEGLPVIASPATFSYRAGKFARRNRTAVVAAAIVIFTLLSATAITGWQARVARRERDRAESRFNQVRKLANTVLFDYHERIKNLPGATEARRKMVTDALEYLDNLASDSNNSPDLQRELALAYKKVGDIQGGYSASGNTGEQDMALQNYRKALAIQEKLILQTQVTDSDLRTLAMLYVDVGSGLAGKGDFQGQEALCRKAVFALSEIVPNDEPGTTTTRSDLARVLFELASALRGEGNLDGAIEEYSKAAQIYERLANEHPDKRDSYLRNAALTFKTMGAIREMKQEPVFALELYRKALAIDAENASANLNNVQYQLDYSFSYNSVASVLTDDGHPEEALENCQKALTIQEKVVADDAKNSFARFSLARTYRRLGDILKKLERFDEASTSYQNSIRKFEEHSSANPENADIKARLGEINSIFGNFLFTWANKPNSYKSKVPRLREAQTFQMRGLEILLTLKSQNALDKSYNEMLAAVQDGLQQTEKELAISSKK